MRRLRALQAAPAAQGGFLIAVAAVALVVANSPLASAYVAALATEVAGLSVLHWINDVGMAAFFLLVGLEIKRELLVGQLATWPQRALPLLAATGGMAAPALVYLLCNAGPTGAPRGWAIPTATDIAFALGVLSLLGPRVPVSLRVFLTALAVIDDLGAVLILALVYTGGVDGRGLAGAAVVAALLWAANRRGVRAPAPYLALGVALWFCLFASGVHAALSGVVLAFAVPLRTGHGGPSGSPAARLEHRLGPWVGFVVVPLFGFANAGVDLSGVSSATLFLPVPLGVALGLLLGKQAGVFGTCALAIRLGRARMPAGATWLQLYGTAVLCGIGFTMSLFVGLLAFALAPALEAQAKLGILVGSGLSALVGLVVLRGATGSARARTDLSTREESGLGP